MNIGIIGCGIIGSRMWQSWQKAGHCVIGWNRTPSHEKDAGSPLADSPTAVAGASDVIKVACPLSERLKDIFSEAMKSGWGEEDFAVLYRLISEKSAKLR